MKYGYKSHYILNFIIDSLNIKIKQYKAYKERINWFHKKVEMDLRIEGNIISSMIMILNKFR